MRRREQQIPVVENQPQFLYITSTGWKTGNPHRIEIWFVEYNKRYYILSEGGMSAHWVQNISHNPQVSFSINEMNFAGTVRKLDAEKEPKLSATVLKLMDAKYKRNEGLIVELVPV